ncbi:hypothetical protein [Candidatus Infernicultor aquiphilus]|uniref:Uncharacterized protein n=1 Tax=Candidatus Infernicultor aquiphilus TaxID=1805029 RepID=A0A1J5G3D4_9BACT|nr:MAG: hypothetical protein AUK42_07500 [Candidatus Atribacteria bacterium CG2_30_33_13]
MTRPLRSTFDHAVYHITARGNRKEKIFYLDNISQGMHYLNASYANYFAVKYIYYYQINPKNDKIKKTIDK